jgi:MYXO-CTERM domain-containing protein
VRFAFGNMAAGVVHQVKLSAQLTAPPPPGGLITNSEVWGGDPSAAKNPWHFHRPIGGHHNSDLHLTLRAAATDGTPFDATTIAPDSLVTYRVSYRNTAATAQHNVRLALALPVFVDTIQPCDGAPWDRCTTNNFVLEEGTAPWETTPPDAAPGEPLTFAPIAVLEPGDGATFSFDVLEKGSDKRLVTVASIVSDEVETAVTAQSVLVANNAPMLRLDTTVDKKYALPGEQLHYTLDLTNQGAEQVRDIELVVWLPSVDLQTVNANTRFQFVVNSAEVFGGTGIPVQTLNAPATRAPYTGLNRQQVSWEFDDTTLLPGESIRVEFDAVVANSAPATLIGYTTHATVFFRSGTASVTNGAPVTLGNSVSGAVFEETTWGGGAGRSLLAAGGGAHRLGNARVELYDEDGKFVLATYTKPDGGWLIGGLPNGSFSVRVPSDTVGDLDTPPAAGLLGPDPVDALPLFWSDGVVDHPSDVGGRDPRREDAPSNFTAPIAALTTATATPQMFIPLTLDNEHRQHVDVGVTFDGVVNTKDAGRGSLRRFIRNANRIAGPNRAIFTIPVLNDPLGRPADPGLVGEVLTITVLSPLEPVLDGGTAIDATTQSAYRDLNAIQLGASGAVGTEGTPLDPVPAPEVALIDGADLPLGLDLRGPDARLSGLAVAGFGNTPGDAGNANVRLMNAPRAVISRCVIGAAGDAFAAPKPAALSLSDGLRAEDSPDGQLVNSLVGFVSGSGVVLIRSDGWTVRGNQLRGNGLLSGGSDGLSLSGSGGAEVIGNLIVDNGGPGIDSWGSPGGHLIADNSLRGNGVHVQAGLENAGVRLFGSDSELRHNLIAVNFGAGVMVTDAATRNTLRFNSMWGNGTITNASGAAPTGQLGIDLLDASDDPLTGSAPFVSRNDYGDWDEGGNGQLNFPVIVSATVSNGTLTLRGYATPNAVIDLYLADSDSPGFGEGKTFLMTLIEGSAQDGGSGHGAYSGAINGVEPGADNTNLFDFNVVVPDLPLPFAITATATVAGATSEFSGVVLVSDACDIDHDGVLEDASVACWPGGPPAVCRAPLTGPCLDNCPAVGNSDQLDSDGDGAGDACDCDRDGDGVFDSGDAACWIGGVAPPTCTNGQSAGCRDNCPLVANADQTDADGDGAGDACGCDADGDGFAEANAHACWDGPAPAECRDGLREGCADNCPSTPNDDQADRDGDAVGDACDCDRDGDQITDGERVSCWGGGPAASPCTGGQRDGCRDNCPEVLNPDQRDGDGDGVGDACACDGGPCAPCLPGEACACDTDDDGIIDASDADCWPGGVPGLCAGGASTGCRDNCRGVDNPDQADADLDGVGDACDCDGDGDGVNECNPTDPDAPPPPACRGGDRLACSDNCPGVVNTNQADADGDGVGDACDPDQPEGVVDLPAPAAHKSESGCGAGSDGAPPWPLALALFVALWLATRRRRRAPPAAPLGPSAMNTRGSRR